MRTSPDFPIRIFYDGSCSVCATAVEHYSRKDRDARLIPVDVSAAGFDPLPYGITLPEFMFQMHVIDRNGRVFRGVEAFWAIWQAFPSSTVLGLCGRVIMLPLVKPIAIFCYHVFANFRGYLPKRDNCSSGSCRIGKG
jgi:predicted DCC family thiol-disulfide oxidoreductase YuxK